MVEAKRGVKKRETKQPKKEARSNSKMPGKMDVENLPESKEMLAEKVIATEQINAKRPAPRGKSRNSLLNPIEAREILKGQQKEMDSKIQNPVDRAMRLLQESHVPDTIYCRDKEKKIIMDFIETGVTNKGKSQTLCKFSS